MLAWYYVFMVMKHVSEADYRVLLFMALQVGFIVAGKVHLYYSSNSHGYLAHAVMADQLANVSLPLMVVLSGDNISYSVVVLILFSSYSFASLAFS
jgi:hypothetical protein